MSESEALENSAFVGCHRRGGDDNWLEIVYHHFLFLSPFTTRPDDHLNLTVVLLLPPTLQHVPG